LKKYLLDTNICIFYIKGQYELNKKIAEVGEENCFISEMTVAELKYGVENSKTIETMRKIVEAFIQNLRLSLFIIRWTYKPKKKQNLEFKVYLLTILTF
jgi:predicted nucleic acid-binding protein